MSDYANHVEEAGLLVAAVAAPWAMRLRRSWLRPVFAVVLFSLLTAVILQSSGSPLHPRLDPTKPISLLWQQVLVSAWWLLGAHLLISLGRWVLRIERYTNQAKLASDLIAGTVYLAAFLIVVNSVLDLPVRGLLATSGVIAIVLGLALQNTLSDVFSGISIGIDRPYVIGDRLWVEGEIEGIVVQVNWRSVRIKTDGGDIATLPNSLVAKSRLINRSKPTTIRNDAITISCDRSISPARVTELLTQVPLLCPAVLIDPAPSVTLVRLGIRNNTYQLSFSVADSSVLSQTKSNLLKLVWRHLRYDSIAFAEQHKDQGSKQPEPSKTPGGPLIDQSLLRETPLFQALSDAECDALTAKLVRHVVDVGQTLFKQDDKGASLYIVASGILEVVRSTDSHTTVLGRIGPGDYVGEIGLLTGAAHAATLTALTLCVVCELKKDDISPLLAERPELAHMFEASARVGQAALDRDAASGASARAGPPGQLLERIRSFFGLAAPKPGP